MASVQNAYSKELIPLNDDSIEVHKLCNILETTFRTGMRGIEFCILNGLLLVNLL